MDRLGLECRHKVRSLNDVLNGESDSYDRENDRTRLPFFRNRKGHAPLFERPLGRDSLPLETNFQKLMVQAALMKTNAVCLLREKQIDNGGDNKNHQYHHEFRLIHCRRIFYTTLDEA
jgi:hypothetical protein